MTPRLMKAKEAAEHMGVTIQAFAVLNIPWKNLDGLCRFDRIDLDGWPEDEIEAAKGTALCNEIFEVETPLPRFWNRKADRPRLPEVLRAEILLRDGEVCAYCGTKEGPWEIDHIFPACKGGSNEPENLAVACRTCNRQKGAKTLTEWRGETQ